MRNCVVILARPAHELVEGMFENEGSALELQPGAIDPWTPIEQVKLSYVIQVLISTLSRTSPIGGLGELAPPTGCGAEPHYNKIRLISPVLPLRT